MCKTKLLNTSKTPARIREQRKRKGWTQDKLAEEISLVENNGKILDGRTVLDWENRKTIPPLGRVQVMAKLFDCDVAYLLGDGEDGVRRRTTADVSAITGLSVQAVERLSQIKETGLSGQLSSLLEWDGLAGLLENVRMFTAFEAMVNLKEYQPELYEASKENERKAVDFFANTSRPVRVEATVYAWQISNADSIPQTLDFDERDYGDILIFKAERAFRRHLDDILSKLNLDEVDNEVEQWLTSKNAATRPDG